MASSLTPEVLKFSAPVFMADAGVYTTTRVQGGAPGGILERSDASSQWLDKKGKIYTGNQPDFPMKIMGFSGNFSLKPIN